MSDEIGDASSHQVKVRKTSPESNPSLVTDDCIHPLVWTSHLIGVARDEASFFAGWCAARQKFVAALQHDFVDSPIKECEEVFNSLTYIFLRRKSVPAVCSPDSAEVPMLHAQPWFCRVLHSLTLLPSPGALMFCEGVAAELHQVLQKSLLDIAKVSDIWTFKKSPSDQRVVIASLERLRAMAICNIDGVDASDLQRCTAGSACHVAEQVQKRCREYAVSCGLVPYVRRAFDKFCGVWVDADVQAEVTKITQSCSPHSVSPATIRVSRDDDMFTLSLECLRLPASPFGVAETAAGQITEDHTVLLCPSFPVHQSRLALLRNTYVHEFEVKSFYERVLACLLRYKAVFHPNGGNWQAAQPHGIFELWSNRLGACIECFASPMNRNVSYPRYFSAFGDVDSPFGSSGSFFDNPPEAGVCFASPPFESDFLAAASAAIVDVVRRSSGRVAYILSLPDWKRNSSCHTCVEAQCDRIDLPSGRGGRCQFMVYSQGRIMMNSAVAAERVGLGQSYTFGIRFYALGFKSLRPDQRIDYDILQQDMRRIFEGASKQ